MKSLPSRFHHDKHRQCEVDQWSTASLLNWIDGRHLSKRTFDGKVYAHDSVSSVSKQNRLAFGFEHRGWQSLFSIFWIQLIVFLKARYIHFRRRMLPNDEGAERC